MQPALNVVMLGPPGAGKGTQAERLAARHRVPKVSTGDILRRAVLAGTALGGSAKDAIDSGNLVGDDAVIGIVKERLTCVDARKACMACGGRLVTRTDDGAGIVRERLKVYQRQTKPLVDYYAPRPTFRSIDGNQAPDAVTKAIDSAIVDAVAAGGTRP